MIWIFLAFVTAALSALSARFLLSAIMEGRIVRTPDHSVLALRVGRAYRVFSWGLVTVVLIGTLIQLFLHSAGNFLG